MWSSRDDRGAKRWYDLGGVRSIGKHIRSLLQRPTLWLVLLVGYAGATHFAYLGSWPLISHEANLAQRTREMMESGGWIVPYLNGALDFQKPPLPFWVGGVLAELSGGVNEWTARIPSALTSIATMLLIVAWVRHARSWRAAITTALVYLASVTALYWGRRAEADSQLMFWITAALVAYWFGIHESDRRRQVLYFVIMWASMGFSILVKGPMGLPVVILTVLVMLVTCKRARQLRRMLPVVGPLLMLAIAAPWYIYIALRHPEAVDVWVEHTGGRFVGQTGREGNIFYYLYKTPRLLGPWWLAIVVGVFVAMRRARLSIPARRFLLYWTLGGLVFLSLSTTKYVHYALLIAPPLLIFGGIGLDHILFELPPRLRGAVKWTFFAHLLLIPAAVVGMIIAGTKMPEYRGVLLVIGLVGALLSGGILWCYWRGWRGVSLVTFAATVLLLQPVINGLILSPLLTRCLERPLAGRYLATHTSPEDGAAMFGRLHAPLVFYAGRPMEVLTTHSELAEWRARHPRGYVFLKDEYAPQVTPLGPWESIPLHGDDAGTIFRRYMLLRVAAAPGAASGTSGGSQGLR
jgi:4-amino-4-deoxy-L-arabinose transferase-like glycosyltransferase